MTAGRAPGASGEATTPDPVPKPGAPPSGGPAAAGLPATRFLLALGRALHTSGYASDRLEEILDQASARLGVEAQFFSQPTSMFAAFGPQDRQQTFLVRVEPGDIDLGRLSRLHTLTREVVDGDIGLEEGAHRVEAIMRARTGFGDILTLAAFGLASATVARFLGGGAREIVAALCLGLITGWLEWVSRRHRGLARVFSPVAAFSVALTAQLMSHAWGGYAYLTATLAGLIVLLPGFTLTTAVGELAQRHLAAGTARLTGAFLQFITLGFGVALAGQLIQKWPGPPPLASPLPLPGWTEAVALLLAPVGLAVLLRAERRDIPGIIVTSMVAYLGARLGAVALGPELGLFVGSFAVAVAGALYARRLDRPTVVTTVPAFFLLVPGSIGFRSVAALVSRDVIPGVDTAFRMVLMAVALAAGLLVANLIVPRPSLLRLPPRRA